MVRTITKALPITEEQCEELWSAVKEALELAFSGDSQLPGGSRFYGFRISTKDLCGVSQATANSRHKQPSSAPRSASDCVSPKDRFGLDARPSVTADMVQRADDPSVFYSENEVMGFLKGDLSSTDAYALPKIPTFSRESQIPVPTRLSMMQSYIRALGYNYFKTPFWDIRKSASLRKLMTMAKEMTLFALPIKCLEATVLGVYLTHNMDVQRIPLSFKSVCEGNVYRHIVLVIRHQSKYGALGLSRRDDLMYKALRYDTLEDLILDYKEAYESNWHRLQKIKLGLPVPHDLSSNDKLPWKHISISLDNGWSLEVSKSLESYLRLIRMM
ncbi:Vasohibin-domain-containing protein [Polychytrium aggregatum]|uniref:Vasohibin-domain-containing protein n=1 Tax=Polychytrium aggregatum TaxID=110093 RepID=UPI0022FDFF42|nr:Vasohibin-domain-containing protein [Polychytrium aggregatum]KAI9203230.1 Vasohibin-domain-containing protein [Polychytrium aggregatum]